MVSTKKCAAEGKFMRKPYYRKTKTGDVRVKRSCVSPPGTVSKKAGPRKPRKDKGTKRGPRVKKEPQVY